MFQAIAKLVGQAGQVDMFITGTEEKLTVTVVPKGDAASKCAALKTPLSLTATAAELDAGFAQALESFAGAHKSLAEQVAQTTALLDKAKKGEAAKALKSPKAPKAEPVGIDDLVPDEPGSGDDGAKVAPQAADTPNENDSKTGLDLAALL